MTPTPSPLLLPRRRILAGAVALLCAPAIVRAASLMPIKVPPPDVVWLDNTTGWVQWQSWPIGTLRPEEWSRGFTTIQTAIRAMASFGGGPPHIVQARPAALRGTETFACTLRYTAK